MRTFVPDISIVALIFLNRVTKRIQRVEEKEEEKASCERSELKIFKV